MKSLLILITLLFGIIFSVTANAEEAKQPAYVIEDMSLNNGYKWEMDEHTRNAFNEMAKSFLSIDISLLRADALKSQGIMLQKSLDNLIQGCTMEGDAHEQLHTFLMEYMPEISALSNTGNIENAEKIQYYLKAYSQYFE